MSEPAGTAGDVQSSVSALRDLLRSVKEPPEDLPLRSHGDDDDTTIKGPRNNTRATDGADGRVELCRSDLLRLLTYLEGELQARDDVIATLKNDHAKQLMYQAKYGRIGLNDPLCALQRDSDALDAKDDFSAASVGQMYDWQLSQLEQLIATQKAAAVRMRHTLTATERRHAKVIRELTQRLQKLDAERKDEPKELTEARERLESLESRSASLEEELSECRAERARHGAEAEAMIRYLVKERADLVEAVMAEKGAVHDLHSRIERLTSAHSETASSVILPLKSRVAQQTQEVDSLRKELVRCRAERDALRDALRQRDEDVEVLRQSLLSRGNVKVTALPHPGSSAVDGGSSPRSPLQRSSSGTAIPATHHQHSPVSSSGQASIQQHHQMSNSRSAGSPRHGALPPSGHPRDRSSYTVGVSTSSPLHRSHEVHALAQVASSPYEYQVYASANGVRGSRSGGGGRSHYAVPAGDHRPGLVMTSHETVFASSAEPLPSGHSYPHSSVPMYSNPAAPPPPASGQRGVTGTIKASPSASLQRRRRDGDGHPHPHYANPAALGSPTKSPPRPQGIYIPPLDKRHPGRVIPGAESSPPSSGSGRPRKANHQLASELVELEAAVVSLSQACDFLPGSHTPSLTPSPNAELFSSHHHRSNPGFHSNGDIPAHSNNNNNNNHVEQSSCSTPTATSSNVVGSSAISSIITSGVSNVSSSSISKNIVVGSSNSTVYGSSPRPHVIITEDAADILNGNNPEPHRGHGGGDGKVITTNGTGRPGPGEGPPKKAPAPPVPQGKGATPSSLGKSATLSRSTTRTSAQERSPFGQFMLKARSRSQTRPQSSASSTSPEKGRGQQQAVSSSVKNKPATPSGTTGKSGGMAAFFHRSSTTRPPTPLVGSTGLVVGEKKGGKNGHGPPLSTTMTNNGRGRRSREPSPLAEQQQQDRKPQQLPRVEQGKVVYVMGRRRVPLGGGGGAGPPSVVGNGGGPAPASKGGKQRATPV